MLLPQNFFEEIEDLKYRYAKAVEENERMKRVLAAAGHAS